MIPAAATIGFLRSLVLSLEKGATTLLALKVARDVGALPEVLGDSCSSREGRSWFPAQ